ncbi:protein TRANSPARENT TESTA 9-like isoform X1 [Arachis duranensis]|uniref:Protein TRANSPARENT TESTA 9-like isoform X1 n=1 Tax=Arachis duranensis TaxID=130453 RepID=A0A6P4CI67_ARADU|nr:protein TRANSPARENT TESTA 9-like isoform X1 [Arachis duranensis]XP_029146805.1 protein TRANSPARENT TESTA 9-like isoform X1 [Arachis hypogaea]XP_029149517.1 protein TRANSPARENT TESTA 9-like isoform X1 [Arachis hypogaea]
MMRSFWRSVDRFSVLHFRSVIDELKQIKVVNMRNRELVLDLLQSVVEIITYGDKHDPSILECFMDRQVVAEFVRMLDISENSRIEAPLLQYLSIMIQNMDNEHAIYYCFSNGYINSIILHPYELDGGDLAPYYVSFLRAVSGKINRDTLCLLVNVHGDAVVSFPLYTEALRFAHHEEKMIQTAVRTIVLNIYNVSDEMIYKFIMTPPVSDYFSVMVGRLREMCILLDAFLHEKGDMDTQKRRNGLILESDKIIDELYYLKDILSVDEPRLNQLVTENLLNGLVFPVLFSLPASMNNNGSDLSAITSLYILSRLLQVVGGRSMINNVAGVILYHFLNLNARTLSEGNASDSSNEVKPFSKCLNEVEKIISYAPESKGDGNINGNYLDSLLEDFRTRVNISCLNGDICPKRQGILAFVFSEDQCLLLASTFLLLILAESKDLDSLLAPMIRLYQTQDAMTNDTSTSKSLDASIFGGFMPEILNALLKVLAFQESHSPEMLWHAGWCLQKLLNFCREGLDDDNLLLFNTAYDHSHVHFLKELDGVWFDHIPDIVRNEWSSCTKVLEQSSQYKDPIFMLELVLPQQSTNGQTSSCFAWQKTVDAVKAFILHFQLKTFIFERELAENPLIAISSNDSGVICSSNVSSASFGSNVSLESGIPCTIAFSNAEIRDVYVVPMVHKNTGKLLLTEKHPFRSRHGVVIAIAPLAGLCSFASLSVSQPTIDKDHPSWLHLRIREFNPKLYATKAKGDHFSMPDHFVDGRWTLGFPDAKACKDAHLAILREITKQRSAVEATLAPLLNYDLGLAEENREK